MSAERVHLTDSEKLELARGAVDHGHSVDHLEECELCAAEVERLSAEEEARLYAQKSDATPDTPPEWFRQAGIAAWDEVRPARTEVPGTEARHSGKWTIPPSRYRWGTGPIVAVGMSSAVAIAASVAFFVRSPDEDGPRAREKAGGVSAELFCAEKGGKPVALGASGATCPPGAELVVNAVSAPDNRLPFLTVVACQGDRCESVSRARFDGSSELTAAGPLMGPAGRVEVILIWSDRELSDEFLAESAKARKTKAGVPSLSLPSSWAQVGFVVKASDDASSP